MKNIRVWMIIVGAVMTFIFGKELLLATKSSSTPQQITCQELINKGPGKNLHITLTDYVPCYTWYVYETKNPKAANASEGPFSKVFMPAMPFGGEWHRKVCELYEKDGDKAQIPAPTNIRVLLKYTDVKNLSHLDSLMDAKTLHGMVINSVESLTLDQKKLLRQGYPTLNTDKCYIVEAGKKPASVMVAGAETAGGILLVLLGIAWMFIAKKQAKKAAASPQSDIPADSKTLHDIHAANAAAPVQDKLETFMLNNHKDILLDDSGNEIRTDRELSAAILEERLSYKKFRKFIGNQVTAANIYAAAVSQLFTSNSKEECEICQAPGDKMTLNWGAKLQDNPNRTIIDTIIALPFLIVTLAFGGITFMANQKAVKIRFSTVHTLCKRCKPSGLRSFAGTCFSVICFILLIILILLIATAVVGSIISFFEKKTSIIGGIACAAVAIVLLAILIWGIHLHRRIEMAIRLPEHFRIIARGPFDLLKAGKVK